MLLSSTERLSEKGYNVVAKLNKGKDDEKSNMICRETGITQVEANLITVITQIGYILGPS